MNTVRIIKVIHAKKKKPKKKFNTHQWEDTKECVGEIEPTSCNIDYTYNTNPVHYLFSFCYIYIDEFSIIRCPTLMGMWLFLSYS